MIQSLTPATKPVHAVSDNRLHILVTRIAAGDRTAFRTLYAFLVMRVWHDVVRVLPCPADARAVTRSTFVEIWHLARHHLDDGEHGTRAWIESVTAHHVGSRVRAACGPRPSGDDYERHTHRELTALLGHGPATVRTAPATFTRVAGLDRCPPVEPSCPARTPRSAVQPDCLQHSRVKNSLPHASANLSTCVTDPAGRSCGDGSLADRHPDRVEPGAGLPPRRWAGDR